MLNRTAVLALLALGCDSSGPTELAVQVNALPALGNPVPPSFRAEESQLTIAGTIDLNEPCYDFAGALGEAGDTLVVRLRAMRQNRPCSQEGALFSYTLTVTGLRSGVQPLRLEYDRVGPPTFVEVVFEGAVEIP